MEFNRASTLAKVLTKDRALEAQNRKDETIRNRRLSDQDVFPGSSRFPEAVDVVAQYLSDLADAKVSSIQDAYAQTGMPLTGQTVFEAIDALRSSLETVVAERLAAWQNFVNLLRARSGEAVAASEAALGEATRKLRSHVSKICEKAESKLDVLLQTSMASAERKSASHGGLPPPPLSSKRSRRRIGDWTRNEKLAAVALFLTVLGIVASFFVPEVRRRLGLEKLSAPTETPRAGPVSPTDLPQPQASESKRSTDQQGRAKAVGQTKLGGNNVAGDSHTTGHNKGLGNITQQGNNNIAQLGDNNRVIMNPERPEQNWKLTESDCRKLLTELGSTTGKVTVGAFISNNDGAHIAMQLASCLSRDPSWIVSRAILPLDADGVEILAGGVNDSERALEKGLRAIGLRVSTKIDPAYSTEIDVIIGSKNTLLTSKRL
jgi:hypothetical protein